MKTKQGKKHKNVVCKNEQIPMPTDNARKIYNIMKSKNVKGKYKDYVLIIGSRLIDWLDSYEIAIEVEEGTKSFGVDGIALVHKRKLKNLLGEDAASKFWKNGMRTNLGVERRRVGCARSKK
jgi:hypothetical protein